MGFRWYVLGRSALGSWYEIVLMNLFAQSNW